MYQNFIEEYIDNLRQDKGETDREFYILTMD